MNWFVRWRSVGSGRTLQVLKGQDWKFLPCCIIRPGRYWKFFLFKSIHHDCASRVSASNGYRSFFRGALRMLWNAIFACYEFLAESPDANWQGCVPSSAVLVQFNRNAPMGTSTGAWSGTTIPLLSPTNQQLQSFTGTNQKLASEGQLLCFGWWSHRTTRLKSPTLYRGIQRKCSWNPQSMLKSVWTVLFWQ